MEGDFVWRDKRLIVEVDGYAYHRAPSRFEDDRARDVRLTITGLAGTALHLDPDHAPPGLGRMGA